MASRERRAPRFFQTLGLEWLWRIKEEPRLWWRYFHDGIVMMQLLFTRVLPLAITAQWQRLGRGRNGQDLLIKRSQDQDTIVLSLSGAATAPHIDKAIAWFRDVVAANRPITIDLAGAYAVDARFLGLLLMLRKQVKGQGTRLNFTGFPFYIARMFRLNGFEFLLSSDGVT